MRFPRTVAPELDPDAVARAMAAAEQRGPVVPLTSADAVRRERQVRRAADSDDRVHTREIPGVAGPLSVRVISADGPVRAVRLCAHASGWCLGSPALDDPLGHRLAAAGITSLSIAYRLAPEHPFPAARDDVAAALSWVTEHAAGELGSACVLAGGASAGAHLMLLSVLDLRSRWPELFGRLAGIDLRYGCYDLGQTPSLRAAGAGALITTSAGTAALLDHFLPGVDSELRRDPSLSPLYADLHGLPPTLVCVGDRDGLLDDSAFLAARLAAAHVDAELHVWAGCPHVFDTLSPPLTETYCTQLIGWLDRIG